MGKLVAALVAMFGVLVALLAAHAFSTGKTSGGLVLGGFATVLWCIAWVSTTSRTRHKITAVGVGAIGSLVMSSGLYLDDKSWQAVAMLVVAVGLLAAGQWQVRR